MKYFTGLSDRETGVTGFYCIEDTKAKDNFSLGKEMSRHVIQKVTSTVVESRSFGTLTYIQYPWESC